MEIKDLRACINFLHEGGMLAKTPRSGFAFLGTGKQSVAEHSYRMTLIGFALAHIVKDSHPVEREKLVMMCLFHDFPEARTGDLNYVNKMYVQSNEAKAIADIQSAYPFGDEIYALLQEYNENTTWESKLAHDADALELMLVLKQLYEMGNPRALDWLDNCMKRLQTDPAKIMAQEIMNTPSDEWWFTILS